MEVGDRVRIVSDGHTFGLKSESINKIGVILGETPDDVLWKYHTSTVWVVETEECTGGHSGRGIGKDGHCWNVDEKDLEKLSMTREDVQAQLYKKLHSVKGVGAATASRCTEAAMEYLDTLVEESGASGGEGAPTDFPWDAIPDKYKWAAWDYDRGDEDNTKELFAYTERPTLLPDTPNIVWSEGKGSVSHIAHICDIPDCAASDGPTLHPSQLPDNLIPTTEEEAGEWLFERPE